MKIITDMNKCHRIIQNHKNSILNSYGYKKILNYYYNPDTYLFFVDGEDIIPLVVKNNFVTFFGGARHNEANILPNNKALLNGMLSYLKKEKYNFWLTAINNDYFDLLEESNKYFDVPYPVEWHYKQIQSYNREKILKASSKNGRKSLRRIINKIEKYTFTTITFAKFKMLFDTLIKKHISYFSERNQETIWKGNENLLLELLIYFDKEENLLIRLIKMKQDIVGIRIIVYNNEEMIFYFVSSLKKDDHFISQIMYLDGLRIAKQISIKSKITQVNALRGTSVNKKRFGFSPMPMYALINDDNWTIQEDGDIDPKSYKIIYGRSSWGRKE